MIGWQFANGENAEGDWMESRRRDGVCRAWAVVSIAAALCALVATGCGNDGDEPTVSPPPGFAADTRDPRDVTVEMRANGYHPKTVRVHAGGTITWIATSAPKATAEAPPFTPGGFDTHTIYRGQSKSLVLRKPGRYRYYSAYDSETFSGVVIVEPRGAGASDGS